AFLVKSNALALALAFVLGAAFATVVSSLVKDVLMPPIGLLLGGVVHHRGLHGVPDRSLTDETRPCGTDEELPALLRDGARLSNALSALHKRRDLIVRMAPGPEYAGVVDG